MGLTEERVREIVREELELQAGARRAGAVASVVGHFSVPAEERRARRERLRASVDVTGTTSDGTT